MSTLDELKNEWNAGAAPAGGARVDPAELGVLTQRRSTQHVNRAIRYFWTSFTFQLLVYAAFTHLFIRFWGGTVVQGLCLAGALLYLPFTIMLLRQFRRVARPSLPGAAFSLQARIQQQYESLKTFYRFKQRYEYLLVPLSTALGVWFTFWLYVPGGVPHYPAGAALTYLLALLACGWAIRRENRTYFEQPLQELEDLLTEFSH